MKKIALSFTILFFAAHISAQPRPVKLSNRIIIDTDCGFDDLRAISMLLSRPEVTVEAILTTDGSLPPHEGLIRVNSLLHEFGKANIRSATGDLIAGINPPWRSFNRTFSWGDTATESNTAGNAACCLAEILNSGEKKVTIVCLGPLTNIEKALKADPSAISKIDRIVWYNESVDPPEGFNYECDKASADLLMKSKIRIDVISNLNTANAIFDTSLVSACFHSETDLAKVFRKVFNQPEVLKSLNDGHSRLADDLVSLYLISPEVFSMNAKMNKLNIRFNTGFDAATVKEVIKEMIEGNYVSERNIVFSRFPVQPESFNYDVRPIIDTTIALYGYDEWKANVMTDEFHGHLGVFSIVGAKMGIRAREMFGVGPDMLEVVTFAGSKPPYSCLTDGIQVSTGATLGMGTIRLAKSKKVSPSAVFTYNDRSVRISLKKEYLDRVDADIAEGISKFGLTDDGYWKLIRRNALRYWVEWDRNKIFEIEEIPDGR